MYPTRPPPLPHQPHSPRNQESESGIGKEGGGGEKVKKVGPAERVLSSLGFFFWKGRCVMKDERGKKKKKDIGFIRNWNRFSLRSRSGLPPLPV